MPAHRTISLATRLRKLERASDSSEWMPIPLLGSLALGLHLVFTLPVCLCAATWTHLGPPGGEVISTIVYDEADPRVVFAGGRSLHRSVNGGRDWRRLPAGLADLESVNAVLVDTRDTRIVHVGTSHHRLLRSEDGGSAWSLWAELPDYPNFIVRAPGVSGSWYSSLGSRGLFRSTDSGQTWHPMNHGLPRDPWVTCLAVDPKDSKVMYVGLGRRGKEGHVFKSTNRGNTWKTSASGLPFGWRGCQAIQVDPADPSVVLVALGYSLPAATLHRSTDGGRTWQPVRRGAPDVAFGLAADPKHPGTLFAYGFGVFRSYDHGVTWRRADEGSLHDDNPFVSCLTIHPRTPRSLLAGLWSGVYGSTDSGTTWVPRRTGLATRMTVADIVVQKWQPRTLWVGSDHGVYRSADEGESWCDSNKSLSSTGVTALAGNPIDPNVLWAGTDGAGIWKSSDRGLSWTAVNDGLPREYQRGAIPLLAVDPTDPARLFARVEDWDAPRYVGLYRSTNGGRSWHRRLVDETNGRVTCICFNPFTSGVVYAGVEGVGIFRSTDCGDTWQQSNEELANLYVRSLAVHPSDGDIVFAGTERGVFISTDAGVSWSQRGLARERVFAIAVDPRSPHATYAGTLKGPYVSLDRGRTWILQVDGLKNRQILEVTIDASVSPSRVYIAAYRDGVFECVSGMGL
ncbi:MAG: hypothetical protein AB1714_24975 [Acidobacteriota bacterium]